MIPTSCSGGRLVHFRVWHTPQKRKMATGKRSSCFSVQLLSFITSNDRLRETDLRLKRPKQPAIATETGAPSTRLKQSNSNSTMISRSPSPTAGGPPNSYREMRQRGFRGTKYDAELLLASQQHQGFGIGQASLGPVAKFGVTTQASTGPAAFLDIATPTPCNPKQPR